MQVGAMVCVDKPVLVVGTGNAEYVLELTDSLVLDGKHSATYHECIGGSGVNYTMRLMHYGIPVFPILPLGNDEVGKRIQELILACCRKRHMADELVQYIGSDDFLVPGLKSQRATILVEDGRRTIFSEVQTDHHLFIPHLKKQLQQYKKLVSSSACPVMIGHIRADHPDVDADQPGQCTRLIIDTVGRKGFVFCNFGTSQILLGPKAWAPHLTNAGILQLNLREIINLFAKDFPEPSLFDILNWFNRHRITAVITLNKFGAIGTYKDGRDGLVFAKPIEIEGMTDPTGAGDAFAAGLVAQLRTSPDFTFDQFSQAIEHARIWSAYACLDFGGSANCPDKDTLELFKNHIVNHQRETPVEVLSQKEAHLFLKIFDLMWK